MMPFWLTLRLGARSSRQGAAAAERGRRARGACAGGAHCTRRERERGAGYAAQPLHPTGGRPPHLMRFFLTACAPPLCSAPEGDASPASSAPLLCSWSPLLDGRRPRASQIRASLPSAWLLF